MVQHAIFLCSGFLQVCNEISMLLRFLQPREDHLGSRNVLNMNETSSSDYQYWQGLRNRNHN